MSLAFQGTICFLVGASAVAIALGRETRWSVLAWWINGAASAALLLGFGAELLAAVMAISVTVCAIASFLHADTFGPWGASKRANRGLLHSGMIFPLLVSAGLGALVVALIRAAIAGAVDAVGAPVRGAEFFAEESFVAFQLVAFFALAAVLGAGVIARPGRVRVKSTNERGSND